MVTSAFPLRKEHRFAVLTLLLLTFFCTCGRAQIGLHPNRIDFQQLRANHTRVIFPKGYEARARRVAAIIDTLQAGYTRSIGEKIYPIDLVLQTATTEINGYVGLAPFRSEFYTTPPQQLNLLSGSDWVDLLTIHEYRHVQQNSNERRGLTRVASLLQGQYGWAVLSSIATPNWFSEGDAVIYETAMSKLGRGRTPAFSTGLRALLKNDVVYSYPKARNNSFRDLVPDHYRYGYGMLTYARERFGNDVWRTVLHDAAAYKGLFYPFSNALKNKTGYTTKALYETTMADLKARQDSALTTIGPLVEGVPIGYDYGPVTNYRFPFTDDADRVLALRSGFQVTPALVYVGDEGRKDAEITPIGIQREPYLHVRDNLVVWMENRQHPRYTNERYSEVCLYDMRSGRKTRLSKKNKDFSPALSFDRREVVHVRHDPTRGAPALIIRASNTGEEIQRFQTNATSVSFPRFSPDGQTIYYLDIDHRGVAIMALGRESEKTRIVRPRAAEPMDYLRVGPAGDLLYTNGISGIDNVYETDPVTGATRQLTNVAIGAGQPHLTEAGNLLYTEATPRGNRLRRLEVKTDDARKVRTAKAGPSIFERPAGYADEAFDVTALTSTKEYAVSDFNDDLGGIRLHSWSYNGSYLNPGVTVEATNALNTVRLVANAAYNLNEQRTSAGFSVDYGGFYPLISLAGEVRERNYTWLNPARDTVILRNFGFSQQRFSVGARVPWRWVSGEFRSALTPSVAYGIIRLGERGFADELENFNELSVALSGSILQRRARQQVQSRLGGTLSLSLDRGLGTATAQRFLARGSVFLPGLHATHGVRIDMNYQAQKSGNLYQYPNFFQNARGYGAVLSDRISRIGFNYQLPILYPEFGIAGITYFQRIRLNAFYDVSRRSIDERNLTRPLQRSAGGQFFFDNVWVNTQPITVGFEIAYLLDAFAEQDQMAFRVLVSGGF